MRHFIYRDRSNSGKIVLAIDASDVLEADQRFMYHFETTPMRDITVEVVECAMINDRCVLPHTVGARHLIHLAPDKPVRVKLQPAQLPHHIHLLPTVSPRKFHNMCFYCGKDLTGLKGTPAYTRDHITPKSLGGRVKVPCCPGCNKLKGQLRLEEYRVMVAYRNGLIPLEILQQVKFAGEEMVKLNLPE